MRGVVKQRRPEKKEIAQGGMPSRGSLPKKGGSAKIPLKRERKKNKLDLSLFTGGTVQNGVKASKKKRQRKTVQNWAGGAPGVDADEASGAPESMKNVNGWRELKGTDGRRERS